MIKKINKKQYAEIAGILTRSEHYNNCLTNLETDLRKLLKEKELNDIIFDFVYNHLGDVDDLLNRLKIEKSFK